MKTNQTVSFGPLRPVSRCVLAALALSGSAQAASDGQKFADVPLYLQRQSSSSEVKVKPNVMLLIDDSGSMRYNVGDSGSTRLAVTKNALNTVLDKYTDTVNWGFQTLNNSGDLPNYTTNHQTIKARVNALTPNGGTPTTRRYYEVSQMMRDATKYRCEKNYIVVMSDGDANLSCDWNNRSIRAAAYAGDGTRYSAYTSFNYAPDPSSADAQYFGTQQAGQCARDNGGPYDTVWDQNDGLKFFSRTLFDKDFKTGGKDAAGKSWDGEDDSGNFKNLYKKQIIETFTVGFGNSLSERGLKYLQNGAATSLSSGYFNAVDADDLVGAFGKIFANIEAGNAPIAIEDKGSVAPATTSSGKAASAAVVELDSGTWSSRLKFYAINSDGSVGSTFSEPSFANRQTIFNDGRKNYRVGKLTAKDKTNADFGISGGTPADQLEWLNVLLPWTARSSDDATLNNLAKSRNYSQTYRIRETSPANKRDLGDILDSSLNTIGDTVNGRNEFLVTAANDGMVHLFQSAAGSSPYDLKVSYIPAGMERDDDDGKTTTMGKYLKDVANEKYGQSIPHRYMVNGGIVVRRTAASVDTKGQQSFMFGAMGQGGRGAYALNIGGKDRLSGNAIGLNASDSTWLSNIPLFETEKGENNKLGYTIGTPQIGRISINRPTNGNAGAGADVRYAGFLASGYRSKGSIDPAKANETALYVYDMLGQEADTGKVNGAAAGSLIQKITVSDGVGGLSSPTLVDADFDGIIDAIYAGDYGGNMYRFDLRGEKPSDWKVSRIYKGNSSQPVTSAPAVSRRSFNKYVVIFGTGSDIYQDDLASTDQQAVYGIFDDLSNDAAEASGGDLLVQTLSAVNGDELYQLSNNAMTDAYKGWTIALNQGGERVVVKPTMILRTAVISARKYGVKTTPTATNGDICIPEVTTTETTSSTMLLAVNAESGGSPSLRDARLQFIKQADATQPYYAGLRQEGIVSFTFLDETKLNDSPVSRDGDSGGSGTDRPLGSANTDIPNNKCFSREAVRTLITNKGGNFAVTGRICGIRRLSWREIFF